jgi:hypothetical protein
LKKQKEKQKTKQNKKQNKTKQNKTNSNLNIKEIKEKEMYRYFFLVSLVKAPVTDGEEYGMAVGRDWAKRQEYIKFGEKGSSDSRGYGFGEQMDLIPKLKYYANLYPKAIFAFYHFYWNCQALSVYTVINGKVSIDKVSLEDLDVGPYKISTSFSIEETQIPNNITCFINSSYLQPFEFKDFV